ncbi:EAL domain-containing protein [Oceanibaculum indicum]|uniref:Putative diguanylate phosphodiesterase n=1 Tax=Oceanibaculum indicum P24 TaxID=1207063 RepID=K2JCY2_9PROT|nr:EAL domain-containing protein [Oceanibaculum indicum]EKE72943.1 putative diguanylate phosphodiesterase [Oceanibaculum indicum P24]
MAFQPILDASHEEIYAHEALVRGMNGESAGKILGQVTEKNRYWFDQQCRVKAIELAAQLGLGPKQRLSINFLPNAVYQPTACIRMTVETARKVGLPLDRIIFEVTEGEQVVEHDKLVAIIRAYKEFGLLTAIDDFGAGYSGLNLLADFQPDIIKLDMALTRNIDSDRVRRSIVAGILTVCRELDIMVIAEGIETPEEYATLREMGVRHFQGYLFARPVFRDFAREIVFPGV